MDNVYEAALASRNSGAPADTTTAAPGTGDQGSAPAGLPTFNTPTVVPDPQYIPDQVPASDVMMSVEDRFDMEQAKAAAAQQAVNPDGTPATVVTTPDTIPAAATLDFDEGAFFDQKTEGRFKSWDEVNAELTKAPVEVFKAPEFVNEDSRLVYEALVAGKVEDILPIIEQQRFVAKISEQSSDVVIKAHLKAQYPSLSDEGIEYEFNRTYAVNEDDFDGNDIGLQVAKAKATDRMNADSAVAKTYFANKASEIKLPSFAPVGQQAATLPQVSEAEAAEIKKVSDYVTALPKVEMNGKFGFEYNSGSKENPLTVKGDVPLPSDKIAEIKSAIGEHPEVYLLNQFFTEKGFDADKFASFVYAFHNLPSLLQTAAGKASDATHIEVLRRQKNYTPDASTRTGDHEPSGDDVARKAMEKFFHIPPATVNGY